MIEIEKTYLAKHLPDLSNCAKKVLKDYYIPNQTPHPHLRLRQNGDKFEITKKTPIDNDPSTHFEHTISLTSSEFDALIQKPFFSIIKTRHFLPYQEQVAEIDVFHEQLQGLVLIDFEFSSKEALEKFQTPDFCLADVTEEKLIAGGILCQKSYQDISAQLAAYGYQKL